MADVVNQVTPSNIPPSDGKVVGDDDDIKKKHRAASSSKRKTHSKERKDKEKSKEFTDFLADQHSQLASETSHYCRLREHQKRKIGDAVSGLQNFRGPINDWGEVYKKLRKVGNLTGLVAEKQPSPRWVVTMLENLNEGIKNPAQARTEQNFENLKKYRGDIADMWAEKVAERLQLQNDLYEKEMEFLKIWNEMVMGVEKADNEVSMLEAVLRSCDLITENRNELLQEGQGSSGSNQPPANEALQNEAAYLAPEEVDVGNPGMRSDALHDRIKLPEEVLKQVHPGSRQHGKDGVTCKPCHFPPGGCWQGNQCPYCHICDKPKRKSKTQRLVEKRRQERYRQIGDQKALDAVKTVDDMRREFLTRSENLKQDLKHAFSAGDAEDQQKAEENLEKVSSMMKELKAMTLLTIMADEALGALKDGGGEAGVT